MGNDIFIGVSFTKYVEAMAFLLKVLQISQSKNKNLRRWKLGEVDGGGRGGVGGGGGGREEGMNAGWLRMTFRSLLDPFTG